MSEMKERAVRAITEEFESGRRVFNDGEAEAMVRVVMEAMREPTRRMLDVMSPVDDGDPIDAARANWQAGIDEAMK